MIYIYWIAIIFQAVVIFVLWNLLSNQRLKLDGYALSPVNIIDLDPHSSVDKFRNRYRVTIMGYWTTEIQIDSLPGSIPESSTRELIFHLSEHLKQVDGHLEKRQKIKQKNAAEADRRIRGLV